MPCQYCSFPQTKGEWWDGGFGLVLLSRTKWRQIMKKLWTLGYGPSGACWGHHLEMCYSIYTMQPLTDFYPPPLSLFCILILSIVQESQTYCFHIVIHWLNTSAGKKKMSERRCGGRGVKTTLNRAAVCVGVPDTCPRIRASVRSVHRWMLTIWVHVVPGHLWGGEPLLEGVRAVTVLIHGDQLLRRRSQRREGVHHPFHPVGHHLCKASGAQPVS